MLCRIWCLPALSMSVVKRIPWISLDTTKAITSIKLVLRIFIYEDTLWQTDISIFHFVYLTWKISMRICVFWKIWLWEEFSDERNIKAFEKMFEGNFSKSFRRVLDIQHGDNKSNKFSMLLYSTVWLVHFYFYIQIHTLTYVCTEYSLA